MNIFLIEEKNSILMKDYFSYIKKFNFNFKLLKNKKDILESFSITPPSLFIIECKDENLEYMKFIKDLPSSAPIICISKERNPYIAIKAYRLGAIDFIHLPCERLELYYHLQSILKLLNIYEPPLKKTFIDFDDIRINTLANEVFYKEKHIPLTHLEYKLLLLLVNHCNMPVDSEKLCYHLWGMENLNDTSRRLQMHISHLRKKLSQYTTTIKITTIYKKGYILTDSNVSINMTLVEKNITKNKI